MGVVFHSNRYVVSNLVEMLRSPNLDDDGIQ